MADGMNSDPSDVGPRRSKRVKNQIVYNDDISEVAEENEDVSPLTKYRKKCMKMAARGQLEDFRKKEANRILFYRMVLSDEKRKSANVKSAERMKRYRRRKKEAESSKRLTRAEQQTLEEKKKTQREYWRIKKAEYRSKQSAQSIRREKEKKREEYKLSTSRDRDDDDILVSDTESQDEVRVHDSDHDDFETDDAKYQALYRSQKSLPKKPKKWLHVMGGLIRNATPRKKKLAEDTGLVTSPQVETDIAVGRSVKKEVHRLKTKRDRESLKTRRSLVKLMPKKTKCRRKGCLKWSKLVRRGALAVDARKKRKDALSCTEEAKIATFYEDNSVTLPCKKNVGKKMGKAKAVLNLTLKRLHEKYVGINKSKIRLTKFQKLRPKHMMSRAKARLNQCLCEKCTNCDLKLQALNNLCSRLSESCKIKDRYKCVDLTICPHEGLYGKRNCIMRSCKECGIKKLNEYLQPLVKRHSETLKWRAWEQKTSIKNGKRTTRKVLVQKTGEVGDLINELNDEVQDLSKHLFVATWQRQQFSKISREVPEGWCVLLADFAENYRCELQDEIQSAHWSYQQATVHPVVVYYQCPEDNCNEVVQESLVFISPDLTHDACAVHSFLNIANEHLSKKMKIKHQVHFTDGCGSQYKSKEPFSDITFGQQDYGFSIERSYFGSNHGKSPCDGLGAVVKQATRNAVTTRECVVQDAAEMYNYLSKNMTIDPRAEGCSHRLRKFFYVQDILRDRKDRRPATGIKGTRSLHCVKGVAPGTIKTRTLSCYCEGCLKGDIKDCSSKAYVDDWKEHHLDIQVTSNEPPLSESSIDDIISTTASCDPTNIGECDPEVPPRKCTEMNELKRKKFFKTVQGKLQKAKDYNSLSEMCKVFQEQINDISLPGPLPISVSSVKNKIDKKALSDVPKDLPGTHKVPVTVIGDGNCFPRCGSIFCFGDESHHTEMRVRIVLDLVKNQNLYLADEYLARGFTGPLVKQGLSSLYVQFSDLFMPGINISRSVIEDLYQQEVLKVIKSGAYNGIWQMFSLSSTIGCPVMSVYPSHCKGVVRTNLHRLVLPDQQRSNQLVHILWTSNRDDITKKNWVPNHFVPLVPQDDKMDCLIVEDLSPGVQDDLPGQTFSSIPPDGTFKDMPGNNSDLKSVDPIMDDTITDVGSCPNDELTSGSLDTPVSLEGPSGINAKESGVGENHDDVEHVLVETPCPTDSVNPPGNEKKRYKADKLFNSADESCGNRMMENLDDVKADQFAAFCEIGQKGKKYLFLGMITDVNHEKQMVTASFLEKCGSKDLYVWPSHDVIEEHPITDIIYLLKPPAPVNNRGQLGFEPEDMARVHSLF